MKSQRCGWEWFYIEGSDDLAVFGLAQEHAFPTWHLHISSITFFFLLPGLMSCKSAQLCFYHIRDQKCHLSIWPSTSWAATYAEQPFLLSHDRFSFFQNTVRNVSVSVSVSLWFMVRNPPRSRELQSSTSMYSLYVVPGWAICWQRPTLHATSSCSGIERKVNQMDLQITGRLLLLAEEAFYGNAKQVLFEY